MESFGSGFFASLKGKIVLCTAAHVVAQSENELDVLGYFGGVGVDLKGVKFFCSDESDIAIAPIENLRRHIAPHHIVTALEDNSPKHPWSDSVALLGFPFTLNRLGGHKDDDLRLLKVLADYIPSPPAGLTRQETRSPIFLKDPGKSRWFQEGGRSILPKLAGVSGGPALQLFQYQESGEFFFQMVGLTIEHHVGKCYVATHRNELRRAAEEIVG